MATGPLHGTRLGSAKPSRGSARPKRSFPAVTRAHAVALIMYTKGSFSFLQVSLAHECDPQAAEMETGFNGLKTNFTGLSGRGGEK